MGVERKGETSDSFAIEESLKELALLADTAGLMVVGSTYQKCDFYLLNRIAFSYYKLNLSDCIFWP